MNIAVATKDGKSVDEHFGKATSFHIFEVKEDVFDLVMISQIDEPYSSGEAPHVFDQERFGRIADKLKLCSKLYVTKIGDAPAEAFRAVGIDPVTYTGKICDIDPDL